MRAGPVGPHEQLGGQGVAPAPQSAPPRPGGPRNDLLSLSSADVDLAVTEAGSSDSRGERADLYAHGDEGLLGGEASYLGPPLTPEKDDALQQATTVANLRAALMSKNSLLSLKADVLGDDSSLLLEYLPKGAHSLSCKCPAPGRGERSHVRRGGACGSAIGCGLGAGLSGRSRGARAGARSWKAVDVGRQGDGEGTACLFDPSRLTPGLLNLQPDRAEGRQWAGQGRRALRESGRSGKGHRASV